MTVVIPGLVGFKKALTGAVYGNRIASNRERLKNFDALIAKANDNQPRLNQAKVPSDNSVIAEYPVTVRIFSKRYSSLVLARNDLGDIVVGGKKPGGPNGNPIFSARSTSASDLLDPKATAADWLATAVASLKSQLGRSLGSEPELWAPQAAPLIRTWTIHKP